MLSSPDPTLNCSRILEDTKQFHHGDPFMMIPSMPIYWHTIHLFLNFWKCGFSGLPEKYFFSNVFVI